MDNEALLQKIKELEEQLSKVTKENEIVSQEFSKVTKEKEIVSQELSKVTKEKEIVSQELSKTIKEKEIVVQQLYEANVKLNETLANLAAYQEKYGIELIKQFVPKNEKIDHIVINETEEIIKEHKKTSKSRKSRKPKKLDYEKYVSEVRDIYPGEEFCPKCGQKLVKAKDDSTYVVEVIPGSIKVIKLVYHGLKCPDCNKVDNKIYYPLSNRPFSGMLTPSLAAYIAYAKYDLGIPFHHLAQHITDHLKFEISKQNLALYMAKCALVLEPIYKRLRLDLLNSSSQVIHSDETTLVVSKGNKGDRKLSYVYAYTSSFYDDKQIRIYDFHETRSIDATSKWLKDFSGILVSDNFAGYNKLKRENPSIKLQKCWAHVRRRFVDILKNLKQKDRPNSYVNKILLEISKLFALEKEYRDKKLVQSQIEARRKRDVPPIKKNLEFLLENSDPRSKTPFEGAINYMKDCMPDLFTFMDNGLCELTNNTCERAIKPFVVQRKIFQTSGSFAGAKYTTILFSIIQTCKINNVDPQKYIEFVLNNLDKPIENILPYSKNLFKT